MSRIDEILKCASSHFAGAHVNAGEVIGYVRRALRNDDARPITFQQGPVTITVEGLPESMPLDATRFEVSVHSHGYDDDNPIAGFVEVFRAMGGSSTFPEAKPTHEYSCKSIARGVDEAGNDSPLRCELTLFPPTPKRRDVHIAAIADALAVEKAVQTVYADEQPDAAAVELP